MQIRKNSKLGGTHRERKTAYQNLYHSKLIQEILNFLLYQLLKLITIKCGKNYADYLIKQIYFPCQKQPNIPCFNKFLCPSFIPPKS
jgi:hypothetical protein